MNTTDFESSDVNNNNNEMADTLKQESISPQVAGTGASYHEGQAPMLYQESGSLEHQVQFFSGADNEPYRTINQSHEAPMNHLAPEVSGFVPIDQFQQTNLVDGVDGYNRLGRRDSSLMCVDFLEPYQSGAHEETDLNQYFRGDPSVQFYQKESLNQCGQSSVVKLNGQAQWQQQHEHETDELHQQVDIDMGARQHSHWNNQTIVEPQNETPRPEISTPSSVPNVDHYPHQYIYTTPEHKPASEGYHHPTRPTVLEAPQMAGQHQVSYTGPDTTDTTRQQIHGHTTEDGREPYNGVLVTARMEVEEESRGLKQSLDGHTENVGHLKGDHLREKHAPIYIGHDVDINTHSSTRGSNETCAPETHHEDACAIHQQHQYMDGGTAESCGVIFNDSAPVGGHNELNHQYQHQHQHHHTQRYSNVAKYDNGGQMIEYRPAPPHPVYHQYNTTFVEPSITDINHNWHAGYFNQHHYHHHHHHQYQIAMAPNPFMEAEDSGKTYHLLGHNGVPDHHHQQIVHSSDTRYEQLYPLEPPVSSTLHKSIQMTEGHSNNYYTYDGTGHIIHHQQTEKPMPGVSKLYDPNEEISSVLMDTPEVEVGLSDDGASSSSNIMGGSRSGSRSSRGGSLTLDRGPRCAPETIAKLKLLLERRKKAREMSHGAMDPCSSSDSVEQQTSMGHDYERISRASSSFSGSGSGRSSPSSISNGSKIAKISHNTHNARAKGSVHLSNYESRQLSGNDIDSMCSGSPSPSPNDSLDGNNNVRRLNCRMNEDRFLESTCLNYEPSAVTENRQLRSRTIVISKRS